MGSGGGKGGGSRAAAPTEVDNSLRSRDTVRVLFCLGEGECKGFPNNEPLKNIYLDETPIQNPDNTYNFTNFSVDYRTGAPDQTPIPGFSAIESETNVNQLVIQSTPVTRTLTKLGSDAVRVRIATDAFLRRDKDGNVKQTRVDFKIQISSNGGPFIDRVISAFDGKSSGAYQRGYLIPLDGTTGPWAIRVRRTTPDNGSGRSDDLELRNQIFFAAFTSVRYTDSAFPGVALLKMEFSAEEFSSVPSVSLNWQGLLDVKVPHNYNVNNRNYSGLFDGSLKEGYTTNTAWCLYWILTNDVWGFGYPPESIDRYSFYALGQYCDELVPDGKGGKEPRYTFDFRQESRADKYAVLQAVLSAMNAQVYEEGGSVVVIPDKYQEPTQIYGPADVVHEYDDDGALTKNGFSYEWAADTEIYTAVSVRWSNPELNGGEDYEEIRDDDAIARYGYNLAKIEAVGVQRRSQVIRKGRHFLFGSLFQRLMTELTVSNGSPEVVPGEVAIAQDPTKSGRSDLAGRIKAISGSTITLDRQIDFPANADCQFWTYGANGKAIAKAFNTIAADLTDNISVAYSAEEQPAPHDFWMLTIIGAEEGQQYRVLNVSENDDENKTFSVQGLIQPKNKDEYIENFLLSDKSFGIFQSIGKPEPPGDVRFVKTTDSNSRLNVEILWSAAASEGTRRYEVEYRIIDDNGWTKAFTSNVNYSIPAPAFDAYQARVRTVNITENRSQWITITSSGSAGAEIETPSDVAGFCLATLERHLAVFKWDEITDPAVRNGGYLQINHSTASVPGWGNSILFSRAPGTANEIQLPLKNGTYLIKAVNAFERSSKNAITITTALDDELLKNYIVTVAEFDDGFLGPKENLFVNEDGFLELTSTIVNGAPVFADSATYEFAQTPDLGANYISRISVDVDLVTLSSARPLSEITDILFRDLPASYFDPNAAVDGVTCEVQIRSDLGIGFGPWESLVQNGEYKGRRHQPRLVFTSLQTNLNARIREAIARVDMPDRDESGSAVSSASGLVSVAFTRPYFSVPVITPVMLNPEAGDRIVFNETRAGFTFEILNGTARIVRDIKWISKGPGKEL